MLKNSDEEILLSVCMIAKNEEAIIGRCIESVLAVADEVIVNDTGSKDNTIKIAEKLGATVITSEWKNDFAYSRNISIKPAKGKWILWLDADDVVPMESISMLEELKNRDPDRIYSIICKNMRPDGTGTSFRQARIFPNNKGVSFERTIHEQMMLSALRLGFKLYDTDIVVEHHGYADPQTLKSKAARNCELLLQEYEKGQEDPVTIIEIADSYSIMEEKESALKWYKEYLRIKDCDKLFPDLSSQAYLGIGKILNAREEYCEAEKFLRDGLVCIPSRVDLRFSLAVNLDLQGRFEEALNELNEIISTEKVTLKVGVDHELSKRKSYKRMITILKKNDPLNVELLSQIAETLLENYSNVADMVNTAGRAYYYAGQLIESLKTFERSYTLVQEGNFEAFAGLISIYMKAGKRDVAVSTANNIKNHFSDLPAFAALCTIHNLLDVSELSADLNDLEKEIEYVKEIFPV